MIKKLVLNNILELSPLSKLDGWIAIPNIDSGPTLFSLSYKFFKDNAQYEVNVPHNYKEIINTYLPAIKAVFTELGFDESFKKNYEYDACLKVPGKLLNKESFEDIVQQIVDEINTRLEE